MEMCTYRLEFQHRTERAIAVLIDDEVEWLPLSQIAFEEDLDLIEKGDMINIDIPGWLAVEKGLE